MGELHCLNVGFGDASVILTESATFLVDCHNISNFSYLLPNNKNITGMFITHQHEDHYSGLNYLKDNNYSIDCLIYSPYNRRYGDNSVTIEEWNEFNSLKEYFRNRGTKLYAPYRQSSFDEPYWNTDGARFEIIGPHPNVANSQTREIHDASLVIKAILGRRKCLFAGDASDANLKYIADYTSHYCDDILHASHHGSINGAHWEFIKKSNAQYTLISTKSGVRENVPHSIALRRYEEYTQHHVRRTDIDGTQKWTF